MSLIVLPENAVEAQSVRGGRQQFTNTQPDQWVRPFDWLPMPAVATTDNKFVGLLAVTNDDTNFIALLARGAYTVDWGDGTVENVADNTQANHQYTYSSISSTTECSRGYRQVLVTVTPQSGQTFTTISIQRKHTQSGLNQYEAKWLDIVVAGGSLTSINIGAATLTVYVSRLERARIISSAKTTWGAQFYKCTGLRTAELVSSATVTSVSNAFAQCTSLLTGPIMTTGSVTAFGSMFANCSTLRSVPLYDTSSATDMNAMFDTCPQLETVPALDTSKVTNIGQMFRSCTSLQSVPAFNVGAVTNTTSLYPTFQSCSSLASSAMTGLCYGITYASCQLSGAAIESISDNLGAAYGAQTLTISSNWGAPAQVSLSGTTTSGSTTVTMASTTGLSTGMEISGTGISDSVSATVQDSGDTFTRTSHGLSDGDRIGVLALNGAGGGIALNTPYYVVNKTDNTFQVADTAGGSVKTITATPKFAGVTSGSDATDANNYTTASVTLTTGRLYLLSVENSHGTSATAISSITGGAGVPTFTSRVTTNLGTSATLNRVSIWSAVPSADYTGTLTINFGGTTQTGACWSLVEVVNVDTATTDGIVTSSSAKGSGTTPSVTAAALGSATNGLFGAVGNLQTSAAPVGRYTEIHDVTAATPQQGLETIYQSVISETIDRTVSTTITSGNWGICYVEVKAGTATADGAATINYGTTISSIVTNTSVTLSVPASASGTITTSSALLKRSKARIHGFTVSG